MLLLNLWILVSSFCGIDDELCIMRCVFGMCVWIFLMCWIDRMLFVGFFENLYVLCDVLIVIVSVLYCVSLMKLVVCFGLVSSCLWVIVFFVLWLFFLLFFIVLSELSMLSLVLIVMLIECVILMILCDMLMLYLYDVIVLLLVLSELFIIMFVKLLWIVVV